MRDLLGGQRKVLEQHAGRSRLAVGIDSDDRTVQPDVLVPERGRARFDCNARECPGQHGCAPVGILPVEYVNDPDVICQNDNPSGRIASVIICWWPTDR